MATEQFSLCWDNFHKNMSMGMQSLLETEDLVDVTLAVEGRYLKAHKMVLSVCSPYFRELFQSTPCKHPVVFMKDVSYIALSDLLHFMYQGEVQVAQENLSTFIKTAEALQIKGLTGDSGTQNESESEQEEKTIETTTKRAHHDVTEEKSSSASRPKRFSGPASKRPKLTSVSPSTSTPTSVSVASTGNKYEVTSVTTNNVDSTNDLKLEPHENSQVESTDETNIEQYGDDNNTFEMADEADDFSLMETQADDPKPGTSTEAGENQGPLRMSRKQRSFTLSEKISILDKWKAAPPGMNQRELAVHLQLPRSTLQKLIANETSLREEATYLEYGDSHLVKKKRNRKGKDVEVEEALLLWFQEAVAKHIPITGPILMEKAEALAHRLGKADFKPTDGWLSRWKARNDIVFKRFHGQSQSQDAKKWNNTIIPQLLSTYDAQDYKPSELLKALHETERLLIHHGQFHFSDKLTEIVNAVKVVHNTTHPSVNGIFAISSYSN